IRRDKSDLVTMGTHGRRGFERWIIGSITERLLRRSPAPVLALSSTVKGASRVRRILVTTDFSKGTVNALNYAFSIAKENHAAVTLLHVLEGNRALISEVYRRRLVRNVEKRLLSLVPADVRETCDVDIRVEAG